MAMPYRNKNQFVTAIAAAAPKYLPVGLEKMIFVNSVYGVDTNVGDHPWKPLATWDAAINKCVANHADVIILMPGHAETFSAAAGAVLDTAGVTTIGMGMGAERPTFTFDTAITADIDISGASNTICNVVFVNGFDNMTSPIHITGADCTLLDIETRDNNASYHCDDFILTAATADRLTIKGWVHRANGGKTGAQTAITLIGTDDALIMPSMIDGDFATACIENVTTAGDNVRIMGSAAHPCYLRTRNAADVLVTCVATTKGHIGPFIYGRLNDNAANITEAFVGADMEFFTPLQLVNLDGERAMESNITASTDA